MIKRGNERLGGSDVGSKGNVMNIAKAKQTFLCLGNLFGGVGASEIENEIDLIKGNSGGYLFGTSRASGKKRLDFKSGGISDVLAGCVGCKQMMSAENSAICDAKLSHKFFFVIFGNDSYINIFSFPLRMCGDFCFVFR